MDAPPRRRADHWRAALRDTPVSWAIAAANVGWFLWIAAHGSTSEGDVLVRFGALDPGRVRAGEWWRLLSAAFVHVGPLHLAMNMAFGIPWCRQLERMLRARRFAALYLAAAVAGTAASLVGQGVLSAGASGAIFGVIGGTLAVLRLALGSWRAFAANRGARIVIANLAILAVAGLWLPLDQWAHGAGFLCGAAMVWLWTRPAPWRRWAWAGFAAALAALVFAAVRPARPLSAYERDELAAARLDEAQRALDADDVSGARRAIDEARALGVEDPRLAFQDGVVLAREGRLEEALERFRALEKQPAPLGADARLNRGRIALHLGELRERGEARPEDPIAALRYYDDACSAGLDTGCRLAARLRGRGAP